MLAAGFCWLRGLMQVGFLDRQPLSHGLGRWNLDRVAG